MSDMVDFYFRQRVTEAELDLAFQLLEKADRNLAADLNVYGVVSGAVPAPHTPVADLSIDLTAPGRAYDNLGQRIFFGTGQTVNCAVDLVGIPTDVATAGNERWLGVFLRFRRMLSDPRTDGNSQQVFFRRDESFELVVRQAPEGAVGSAPRVALQPDELLVCDVRRRPAQIQIVAADIDTTRRQAFIFAQGNSVAVQTALWTLLQPAAGTAQAAFDEIDAELSSHFSATGRRHAASAIDSTPRGFVSASTVQGAINELVDDLSSINFGAGGALRVGAEAVGGIPNSLTPGSVGSQLASLLGFINTHLAQPTDAHDAVNISLLDTPSNYAASNAEDALAEMMSGFRVDHYQTSVAQGGQHKTIHQPNLGGTKALLWDSLGNGGTGAHFRVYADNYSIWFTVNASWNGSAWTSDNAGWDSGGFRFSGWEFEIIYQPAGSGTFGDFGRRWRIQMSGGTNSAFVLTGAMTEEGRLGTAWSNTASTNQTVASGGSSTFRSRFEATPSSITLSVNYFTGVNTPPSVVAASRDGFGYYGYRTLTPGQYVFWMGTYTATA